MPNHNSDAKTLSALAFRWQELPTENYGSKNPSLGPLSTLDVGGREARLHEYIQYSTYSGLLAGIPRDPEREILKAVQVAETNFSWFKAKALVIPPRVRIGSRGASWAVVPPIATIALFCDGSDMVIAVWFQDDYGLPTDTTILDALATVDMKVHSEEWDP